MAGLLAAVLFPVGGVAALAAPARPGWAVPDWFASSVLLAQAGAEDDRGEDAAAEVGATVDAEATGAGAGTDAVPEAPPGAVPPAPEPGVDLFPPAPPVEVEPVGPVAEPEATEVVAEPAPDAEEVVERRTASTRTFDNGDGTFTYEAHGAPIHAAVDGEWVPVDLDLELGPDGTLVNGPAQVDIELATEASADELAVVSFTPGRSLAYGLEGAAEVEAVVEGPTATYPEVLPGVDLELESMPRGLKEIVVLATPEAPSVLRFPLALENLTAHLDEETGAVELRQRLTGFLEAVIPPGFMVDSGPDGGARSEAVTYALEEDGEQTVLVVTADRAWLDDPGRVWPVRVDPTVIDRTAFDDTWVQESTNVDRSGQTELAIGPGPGFGLQAAAYLKFHLNIPAHSFATAATLKSWNSFSAGGCTPHPVGVYRVTGAWTGSTMRTWPGAAYSSTAVDSRSFARGGGTACQSAWVQFDVQSVVNGWLNGSWANNGLTLRVPSQHSSNLGTFKRFGSIEGSPQGQVLTITYTAYAAAFNPGVDWQDGVEARANRDAKWPVQVRNRGSVTWPANGTIRLGYRLYQPGTDNELGHGTLRTLLPTAVAPGQVIALAANVKALPPGVYDVRWDMVKEGDFWFRSEDDSSGAITRIQIHDHPLQMTGAAPLSGATVNTLRPPLSIQTDSDDHPAPPQYFFRICPGAEEPSHFPNPGPGCLQSGWQTSSTWTPPDLGVWNRPHWWWGFVRDGTSSVQQHFVQPSLLVPALDQPSSARWGVGGPTAYDGGVDLSTGNFVSSVVDAEVATGGPPLVIRRTYNSQAAGTAGAFGAGWSSILDLRITPEGGTGDVVALALADGRVQRWGRISEAGTDGVEVFRGPMGSADTLTRDPATGAYEWVTPDRWRHRFAADGTLGEVVDPQGRVLELVRDLSGRATRLRSVTPGAPPGTQHRELEITWSGSRVIQVRTDPVTPGGSDRLAWTYSYSGTRLATVCDPRPVDQRGCVSYGYHLTVPGLLTSADDDHGRYLTLTYDVAPDRRVQTRRDGEDHVWAYAYTSITCPGEGGGTGCSRATVHQPFAASDHVPGTPAPSPLRFDFDPSKRLVARTDEDGQTARWVYDASGQLSREIDENGSVRYFWHSEDGRLVGTSFPRGDSSGQPLALFLYNWAWAEGDPRHALPLAVLSPNGHATTMAYDDQGRLVSRTTPWTAASPGGRTESWAYDGVTGQLVSSTDQAGRQVGYEYDPATGDLVRVTSPTGVVAEMTHDGLGRVRTISEHAPSRPTPLVTTLTYDALGNVVRAESPEATNVVTETATAQLVTRQFDRSRRLVQESVGAAPASGAGGPVGARTVAWSDFDGNGRPTRVVVGPGSGDEQVETTTWTWRGLERTVDVPGATRYHHRYTRTGRPHQVSAQDLSNPGVQTLLGSTAYDPAGRVASTVDAMGMIIDHTYWDDGLPRRTSIRNYNADGLASPGQVRVLEDLSYDAAGNLTQAVTRNGTLTTTYGYSAADELLWLEAPGRRTDLTYRPDGQLGRTSTSGGGRTEVVDFGYRALPEATLERILEPTGVGGEVLETVIERDEWGRATATIDPGGRRIDTEYDALGRPVRTTLPPVVVEGEGVVPATERPVHEVGYDVFGAVTHERTPDGEVTTSAYDVLGRLALVTFPSVERPDGGGSSPAVVTPTRAFTYDQASRTATTEEVPVGGTTTEVRDYLGRPQAVTDGAGGVEVYGWNAAGRLTGVTEPGGRTTLFAYDTVGNLRREGALERFGAPGLFWTTYGYDAELDLTSMTLPEGGTFTFQHNGYGEEIGSVAPSAGGGAITTSIERDLKGRAVSVVDALGRQSEASYDLAGRLLSTRDRELGSLLRETTYALNPSGEVTAVTTPGPNLGDGPVTTSYHRDGHGNVTGVEQPGGITTGYGYDVMGRLVRSTDGNGQATWFGYNAWGDVETVTDPATAAHPDVEDRRWEHSYAAPGLLGGIAAPDGVAITRAHDVLGRLVSEEGTGGDGGPVSRSVTWDAAGRPATVTGGTGTATFSWDDRDNLLGVTGAPGASSFAYDRDGNMTSRTDAAGTSSFTYWPGGQLESMSGGLTGASVEYSYDSAGQPVVVSYDGGASVRELAWDGLGNPVADVLSSGSSVIASQTWVWGPDGVHLDATTVGPGPHAGAGVESYQYDGAGRLVETDGPAGTVATAWDAAGNRVGHGGTTAVFDERNRLVSSTDGSGTTDYSWSARGVLEERTPPSGPSTSFSFDAFDQLIAEDDGSTVVDYAWDGLGRLAEVDGQVSSFAGLERDPVAAGGQLFERGPGGGVVGVEVPGGEARLVRSNHRGDVTSTFSPGDSAAAFTRGYSPHGASTEVGAESPGVGFQGDWTSASGLVHMDARWYDPATGAFLSRDTWNLGVGDAAYTNRYTYGAASPTIYTDPTGHFSIPPACRVSTQAPCQGSIKGAVRPKKNKPSVRPKNNKPGVRPVAAKDAVRPSSGRGPSRGSGSGSGAGGGGGGGSGTTVSRPGRPGRPAPARPSLSLPVRPGWSAPAPTYPPPSGHLNPPSASSRPTVEISRTVGRTPLATPTPFIPGETGTPQVQFASTSSSIGQSTDRGRNCGGGTIPVPDYDQQRTPTRNGLYTGVESSDPPISCKGPSLSDPRVWVANYDSIVRWATEFDLDPELLAVTIWHEGQGIWRAYQKGGVLARLIEADATLLSSVGIGGMEVSLVRRLGKEYWGLDLDGMSDRNLRRNLTLFDDFAIAMSAAFLADRKRRYGLTNKEAFQSYAFSDSRTEDMKIDGFDMYSESKRRGARYNELIRQVEGSGLYD